MCGHNLDSKFKQSNRKKNSRQYGDTQAVLLDDIKNILLIVFKVILVEWLRFVSSC